MTTATTKDINKLERYGEILKVLPNAIIVVDRDGIIVAVNKNTIDMFGYDEDELIGKPIEILVPIDIADEHRKAREKYIRHPSSRMMGSNLSLYGKKKDGTTFPIEVALSPLYLPDLYVVAAIDDIGETADAYEQSLIGWANALDLRDNDTRNHTERVTTMTLNFCKAMGFDHEELSNVRRGAILHDIGKIGIPDSILNKAEPLTDEEFEIMKKHPVLAKQMIEPIKFLSQSVQIPYYHHERWDGTGYPQGLIGAKIPLEARIFSIIDVYDALTSDRVYRKAWTKEETLKYIKENSGKLFDPYLVDYFLLNINEIVSEEVG